MKRQEAYVVLLAQFVLIASAVPFQEPLQVRSTDGAVRLTLEVSLVNVTIGNYTVPATVYNGHYIPPTITARPGERIELLLRNKLEHNITNIHFHGLIVSPSIPQDDVFIEIAPGMEFQYNISLPHDHPKGLFWYHSHAMGLSELQVFNGLSGAIVIEGNLDSFPAAIQNLTQHQFLMKEVPLAELMPHPELDVENSSITITTVNGQQNPQLTITPEELQLFRFAAISANRYWHLYLDGVPFYVLAVDGLQQQALWNTTRLLLPPASRMEVFIRGPPAGVYTLKALKYNTGPDGDDYEEVDLLTLVSEGQPANPKVELPTSGFQASPDLRTHPVAQYRTIVFSEDDDFFYIDGQLYDPERVDAVAVLGTVEEWTIINNSSELHAFHIHQVPFQVIAINNISVPFYGRQDIINVPYSNDTFVGSATLLIPFLNPNIVGKFVYHCHILEHEDGGMMATIQVVNSTDKALGGIGNEASSFVSSWIIAVIMASLIALLFQ